MLILPAIDLRGGRCVRLTHGNYNQETAYHDDPVAVAESFANQGAEWLHVVDLDGARAGQPMNLEAVARIVRAVGLPVQFGGGVRSLGIAEETLALGVARVILGTSLTADEALAAELFQILGDRAVAGIDTRGGQVAIQGWTETSGEAGIDFARRMEALGARRIVFTDVATDGALSGPNLFALDELLHAVQVPVIASGGVACLEDIAALAASGVEGAIVGKALYENRFTVAEALAAVRT